MTLYFIPFVKLVDSVIPTVAINLPAVCYVCHGFTFVLSIKSVKRVRPVRIKVLFLFNELIRQ